MKILLSMAMLTGLMHAADVKYDYKVLATTKTSSMEGEMNQAAADGYQFDSVMGGETTGGSEVVVVMSKTSGTKAEAARSYKLLATSKTSTMEKELQQVGAEGYDYAGQTVFSSSFGGREVTVILEKTNGQAPKRIDFRVIATTKTSTFDKELNQAGLAGFELAGMTVAKTSYGGNEQVAILRREAQ